MLYAATASNGQNRGMSNIETKKAMRLSGNPMQIKSRKR